LKLSSVHSYMSQNLPDSLDAGKHPDLALAIDELISSATTVPKFLF
jgi:hypothetical protein